MRNCIAGLTITLLAASGPAFAAGPVALELRRASPADQSYVKVWIGLRNTGSTAQALCVKSAFLTTTSGGGSVVPFVTHSCTTESEVHLVLPGEAYWVLSNFPGVGIQGELTVSVDVISWRQTEIVTTAVRSGFEVSRKWRSLAMALQASEHVIP